MKNISELLTEIAVGLDVSGTLQPVDIDLYVRIDELDRKINLGGTAELSFRPCF